MIGTCTWSFDKLTALFSSSSFSPLQQNQLDMAELTKTMHLQRQTFEAEKTAHEHASKGDRLAMEARMTQDYETMQHKLRQDLNTLEQAHVKAMQLLVNKITALQHHNEQVEQALKSAQHQIVAITKDTKRLRTSVKHEQKRRVALESTMTIALKRRWVPPVSFCSIVCTICVRSVYNRVYNRVYNLCTHVFCPVGCMVPA